LSRAVAELEGHTLVGQGWCRKYSMRNRRAREVYETRWSSLCCSALIGAGTQAFRKVARQGRKLLDCELWAKFPGHQFAGYYVTGIKCMPGRGGIDSGHGRNFGEIADPDGSLLRNWLGDDAHHYEQYLGRTMSNSSNGAGRYNEINKYQDAYRDPAYGMGVRRKAHVQGILQGLPPGSLLDIGTGRGETLQLAQAAGHDPVAGTEVVKELLSDNVFYGEAHHIPFASGSFDYVTCFDVLEHLIEDDIRPCLQELYRVARRACIVSASERTSRYKGRELHISRRPKAKWLQLIRECWPGAYEFGAAGASPCFRTDKPAMPCSEGETARTLKAAAGAEGVMEWPTNTE
jgi:SAM-dependent methyltransferase